jgi:hypothetical protein
MATPKPPPTTDHIKGVLKVTEEQFKKAQALKDKKSKILKELKTWEKALINKSRLGYLPLCNGENSVALHTEISHEVFDGFRCAAMDNLKLKLVSIDREFAEI